MDSVVLAHKVKIGGSNFIFSPLAQHGVPHASQTEHVAGVRAGAPCVRPALRKRHSRHRPASPAVVRRGEYRPYPIGDERAQIWFHYRW